MKAQLWYIYANFESHEAEKDVRKPRFGSRPKAMRTEFFIAGNLWNGGIKLQSFTKTFFIEHSF